MKRYGLRAITFGTPDGIIATNDRLDFLLSEAETEESADRYRSSFVPIGDPRRGSLPHEGRITSIREEN